MTGHAFVVAGAKALDVLGYRRMLRVEWSIVRTTRGLRLPPGVRVGLAGLEDYLELGHPTGREEAERRVAAGHRILGIWRDGRLACASWIAEDDMRVPYLRVDVPLGPRELYHYDAWLPPEVRGHGLSSHLGPELVRLGREEGKHTVISHIWPENVRSLNAAYRNMGRVVGLDMAFRLPGGTVHRERRWEEHLVAWERPSGRAARARHSWFVRYTGRRVAQLA